MAQVWCFLENVRSPTDPRSGCYSDVTWSERDGRFWSSKACFQAGNIFTRTLDIFTLGPGPGYRGRRYCPHRPPVFPAPAPADHAPSPALLPAQPHSKSNHLR